MNSEPDNSQLVEDEKIKLIHSQSSVADLEQFAAKLVEDLQIPLSSLNSLTALLISECQDDLDDVALSLQQVNDSEEKIQALVADLQTYAKAGTSEQTWLTVDLNSVLDRVLDNLQGEIRANAAEITSGDLPRILINPQEIHQILTHLIDNGLKFAKTSPKIEITAARQLREWVIAVADNGIGIAEASSDIFKVFQRLHPDVYPGSGIGLAICQKIVHRYGGRIWVESTIDCGSTFYFTIPINISPSTDAIAA